jgi:putative CocE/NonD family hydrolase
VNELAKTTDAAAPGADVVVQYDVPARMRDGAILYANVFRPAREGRWPVLLTRLPYGKDSAVVYAGMAPLQVARSGFLVVFQDVRGCFKSEGDFVPFKHEGEDGFDTVEWAARLPGANGKVVMFGGSYFGNTQWSAAIAQPPSLAGIAPVVTWAEPLDGLFQRGGAYELGLDLCWSFLMGLPDLARKPMSDNERMALLGLVLQEAGLLGTKGYWDLPARSAPTPTRYGFPQLGGRIYPEHPEVREWPLVAGKHEQVTVPSFNIAGWYDCFLQGSLDNFTAMDALGRDARLIIGPWSHMNYTDAVGDLSFGMMANRAGAPAHPFGDLSAYQMAWSRHHADSSGDIKLPPARIRLFVMGRNVWRDENEWPLARARNKQHFLRADGSLTTTPPNTDEGATEFTYDPADPVPTVGGPLVMPSSYRPGPLDQARVEARKDVCCFTSAPLEHDLEVTGRIRVVLNCRSSAPSTDWVARLCDVHPDGRSFNLVDGIVRIKEGADSVNTVEIDLWSTSNVFLAGHRLRVHVTSSSFPRWDRNLNTGDQESSNFVTARQVILHDAEHASFIELPVVA